MDTSPNPYDQFEPNPFDKFDTPKEEPSKLEYAGKLAKHIVTQSIPYKVATKSSELLDKAAYESGGAVTDITGSPAAGAATNALIGSIPMLAGGGEVSAGKIALSQLGKMNPVKAATLETAMREGYIIPPSAAEGGFLSKRLESIGGKAAIGQEAAIRNQQITNKIAAKEAGLAEGDSITEATLSAARERIAEPYRQISELSPSAAKALENLKQTRSDSKVYWRHYNMQGDPKSLAQAQNLDSKAEALEAKISKIAGDLAPDLLPALREARVQLAKNHDVEKALNLGTGDVDAKVIGRMLDKRGEKAVTGGLQTIGKFAEAFPSYAREASGIPTPGVSKSEALSAALLGIGGYGATQYGQGSPIGAAAGLLPLLSGPARGIALSRMMQEGIPLSGQLSRPIQGSMVPLSKVGQPEPGRY